MRVCVCVYVRVCVCVCVACRSWVSARHVTVVKPATAPTNIWNTPPPKRQRNEADHTRCDHASESRGSLVPPLRDLFPLLHHPFPQRRCLLPACAARAEADVFGSITIHRRAWSADTQSTAGRGGGEAAPLSSPPCGPPKHTQKHHTPTPTLTPPPPPPHQPICRRGASLQGIRVWKKKFRISSKVIVFTAG